MLLAHDPSTGITRALMDNLWFANGVAVAMDNTYVLIADSIQCKVFRSGGAQGLRYARLRISARNGPRAQFPSPTLDSLKHAQHPWIQNAVVIEVSLLGQRIVRICWVVSLQVYSPALCTTMLTLLLCGLLFVCMQVLAAWTQGRHT